MKTIVSKNNNPLQLSQITVKGFKSFDNFGQTITPNNLTVLLGANGSGKSNLVAFFKMLNYMMNRKLQLYVGEHGTAESLLFYGPRHTKSISASLTFNNMLTYSFTLNHAAGDTLVFNKESLVVYNQDNTSSIIDLNPDIKESGFQKYYELSENMNHRLLFEYLTNLKVFQFHDTTTASKIRNKVYINDCRHLHSNGGNLSAFLFAMKNISERKKYYDRIIRYLKHIIPRFDDFVLEPFMMNNDYIQLNWKEKESDYIFGPHQLSDGSLRYIALASLLLQPPDTSPSFIIIDEPELGLHPSAISSFAGMVKSVSQHKPIILATHDRFIFFFSGHGTTETINDEDFGYIIPYDGKEYPSYISIEDLKKSSILTDKETQEANYYFKKKWEKIFGKGVKCESKLPFIKRYKTICN